MNKSSLVQELVRCQQRVVTFEVELTELRSQIETLRRENDRLRQSAAQNREAELLGTIAQVANLLLKSTDYTTVIPDVVRMLGEAAGYDRCSVIQELKDSNIMCILAEWDRPGISKRFEITPEIESLMVWDNFYSFHESCARGEVSNFLVADIEEPAHSILASQGCTSFLVVPIMLQDKCCGEIGFENCGEPRLFDESEVAILKIAADSIAAAIERQAKDDELRKSESLYRSLFEISNEGMCRWEIERPIALNLPIKEQVEQFYQHYFTAQANDVFAQMYGLAKGDDAVGLRLTTMHVFESQKNQEFITVLAENGYRIRNAESEEIEMTGKRRYFLNSGFGFIENNCVTGGWGTQIDITELREAQQALLEAEQQRVAELAKTNQALKNSIDRLAADRDLNAFLGHVVLEITQQLNLHTAWVELYQPSTQTLRMHLFVEQGQLRLEPHNLPDTGKLNHGYLANENILWNWLLQTKQPLVITPDTLPQFFAGAEIETHRQWGLNNGFQSGINMVLMMGDEPLGLLVLFSTERSTFTQEELELVQALAQQATLAIALTRLAEESRQLAVIRDRNHLAREIHDTLAQGYAGILMQIQAAKFLQQQPDQSQIHLERASALAREGIGDARRSVWLLQQDSQAYSDVSAILLQLVEQMAIGTSIKPTIAIKGTPRSVKPDLGMHLLRVTQESLNNALRHAQASEIDVRLTYLPKHLEITIGDNGRGFEPDRLSCGFGIKGMRQRAELIGADFQIDTQADRGTQIRLTIALTEYS